MRSRAIQPGRGVAVLVGVAAVLGAVAPVLAGGEDAVRKAFTDFQAALKAKDAARLWQLLDSDSQADAERSAKKLRQDYNKAGPAKKAQLEKVMGLPGAELAKLKGEGFLKTKRFLGKYDEVPPSKIDRIVVEGKTATVHYVEPDGDKETFRLKQQKGKWKLVVPMP
jgi:hypothetical protein